MSRCTIPSYTSLGTAACKAPVALFGSRESFRRLLKVERSAKRALSILVLQIHSRREGHTLIISSGPGQKLADVIQEDVNVRFPGCFVRQRSKECNGSHHLGL
jgi:hypothetical protein